MFSLLKIKKIIEIALFIVGTSIGGGALALPLCIVDQGVFYGIFVLGLTSAFAFFSSIFILEAFSEEKSERHFFYIFNKHFGAIGKYIGSFVYIFICFASLVAYISGIGDVLCLYLGIRKIVSYLVVSLFHCCILFFPRDTLKKINSAFVLVMFFSILFVTILLFTKMNFSNFNLVYPSSFVSSFPIFMAAFSFQMIVPSILGKENFGDRYFFHKSILLGVIITFLIYLSWILLVFSVFPIDGSFGIRHCFKEAIPVNLHVVTGLRGMFVDVLLVTFATVAMSSSFIGVGLALVDFIYDMMGGYVVRNNLVSFTVLTSFLISFFFDKLFIFALSASGGFGDSVINGLMPSFIILKLILKKSVLGLKKKSLYVLGLIIVVLISLIGLYVEFGSLFTRA